MVALGDILIIVLVVLVVISYMYLMFLVLPDEAGGGKPATWVFHGVVMVVVE
jgi:hypothetical protein